MFTCESMAQVFFLINSFGRGRDISAIRYLGYDRACCLHPYLKNLKKKEAPFAKYILKNVKFLVDRFHVAKHVSPTCMPPDNPSCQYHPDQSKFSELKGCNTQCAEQSFAWINKLKSGVRRMSRQCAEQSFAWINKLKSGVRRMSRFKFNMYLTTMINIHNEFHCKKL